MHLTDTHITCHNTTRPPCVECIERRIAVRSCPTGRRLASCAVVLLRCYAVRVLLQEGSSRKKVHSCKDIARKTARVQYRNSKHSTKSKSALALRVAALT